MAHVLPILNAHLLPNVCLLDCVVHVVFHKTVELARAWTQEFVEVAQQMISA